jgi:hypothetical protein
VLGVEQDHPFGSVLQPSSHARHLVDEIRRQRFSRRWWFDTVVVQRKRRLACSTPRANEQPAADLGTSFARHLHDQSPGAAERIEPPVTGKGARQGVGAVADVGGLLEPLVAGQLLHAAGQRTEHHVGSGGERLGGQLHVPAVGVAVDRPRTGTGGHPQLGGRARRPALGATRPVGAPAQRNGRLHRLDDASGRSG